MRCRTIAEVGTSMHIVRRAVSGRVQPPSVYIRSSPNLPAATPQNLNEFGDLLPLLTFVATGDRVLDTMTHMISQYFLFNPAQRCPHRRNLRHDINAISVVIDHFCNTAYLPLNPAQPFKG